MKTRFSPSPTGHMHLGNARTALFSLLLGHKDGGDFLLRIEDTDQERSKQEFVDQLLVDLQWLNLNWQDGPYYQSERNDVYAAYYDQLLENDQAYMCFATEEELELSRKLQRMQGKPPRYDQKYMHMTHAELEALKAEGKPYTLRLRVPDEAVIEFDDLVCGAQKFVGKDIGDFIIRRQDGTPTFMFCNAVDDSLMEVTHVMRGVDHITNTPRQLLILRALKLREPIYGHISLITGSDGGKLSKREGGRSIKAFREAGYLADALTNYLARLGHHYSDEHFMTMQALAEKFETTSLSKSPAKFDEQQLNHWQKEAVMRLDENQFWYWVGDIKNHIPEQQHTLFFETIRPNVLFPQAALQWVKVLYEDDIYLDEDALSVLKSAHDQYFIEAKKALDAHGPDAKAIIAHIKEVCGVKGKALFQPLRVALTGQLHGPELGPLLQLIGQARLAERFTVAQG